MQKRRFTGLIILIRLVRLMAFTIAAVIVAVGTTPAEDSPLENTDKSAENDPIQITADRLVSNNEEKYAEFIGNVKATQADYVMTSQKLRIYYRGDLLNTDDKGSSEEKLKKIIASGDVKIKTEQYEAVTESAEWDTDTGTITLAGDNSTITMGKNSITGSKITLFQKDGRVNVEGSKKKRIKAVFYSEGKPSDAFKFEKPKE